MSELDFLADIQSRLAFQEDAIQHLENFQSQQHVELEQLKHLVRELAGELQHLREELGQGERETVMDEKPPHY